MRRAPWVLVVFVLSAGVAYADAENPAATGKSTYGLAGCGLGSMLFGDQKGMIQILAATTNGTFGSQTFGITSAPRTALRPRPVRKERGPSSRAIARHWRKTPPVAAARPSPR